LLALNVFLLIVGCMLDIFSAIIVVVPLILPLANAFGVDPLHLGVIFLTNLEIGYLTPPVGMNLFLSAFRFRRPLTELYAASIPFILVLFAALMLITYVPELSLFLVER
jgi:C4-dicarboxylate transporter, DctM subunit